MRQIIGLGLGAAVLLAPARGVPALDRALDGFAPAARAGVLVPRLALRLDGRGQGSPRVLAGSSGRRGNLRVEPSQVARRRLQRPGGGRRQRRFRRGAPRPRFDQPFGQTALLFPGCPDGGGRARKLPLSLPLGRKPHIAERLQRFEGH